MPRVPRVVVVGRVIDIARGDAVVRLHVEIVPSVVVCALMTAGAFERSGATIGADLCVTVRADQLVSRFADHRAARPSESRTGQRPGSTVPGELTQWPA
jgi:molybdopterin-binding protein